MVEGSEGFVYPEIDPELCVDCGACKRACGFRGLLAQETEGPWYAASYGGDSSRSASAGAFYALALAVLESGGVVFGAAYEDEADGLRVRHVMAEDERALDALRGSKYVQSDAGRCFPEVARQLALGREVLFSGTPCQVAGLRGYLGRGWSNLVTVDLVCHGVPPEAMLRGYLRSLEDARGSRVVDARFRSKRNGWDGPYLLEVSYANGRQDFIPADKSCYYDLFLGLRTLRDSCHSCPFAGPLRPGDISVGDFWGVGANRPDVLADGRFDTTRGVSCLLVNSERGRRALGRFGTALDLFGVSFDDIAAGNDQLRHPSALPEDRELYLDAFREGGWGSVEALWRRRERGVLYWAKRAVRAILPESARSALKRVLGRA